MAAAAARRRGIGALGWVVVALLVLFGAQVVYQKFYANHPRFTPDEGLIAELAAAEIEEEPPPSPASGWPQWRGLRRDGVAHEPDLLMAWPRSGPPKVWEIPGGEGYSAFAVAGGRAYSMLQQNDRQAVVCWNAADGKELWRAPLEGAYSKQFAGPRSTPTLDGDRLYAVSAGGQFACLTADTGHVLWKHDLLAEFHAANLEWGIAGSPLVDGDLVFVNPGGPNGHSVAAFHKSDGRLAWKALDDPAGYSSPVALTASGVRQVVFFTGAGAVGVAAADGKLLWRFPWLTDYGVNAATPLTFKARKGDEVLDYVFISSGYGKGCALVKIEGDGKVGFRARRVYEGNQMCNHFASPVRYHDHFYGLNEAKLTCMDVRTGQVKWERSGFQKGSLLRVDGYLLVLGEYGKLALMEATPEEPPDIASASPLGRRRCWTMPALADGKLYLRDETKVLCLKVRK
ncbi:MAG TPA: PQQ-binding-like beta-propeller repeat protein [Gemmataceae bacterium]|jgi:outer membrane protein assembly factor BamB|nr:PQQ-binding-like beta-propeller repeat protein [Gemmataceae bacterium]